jgi:hypothetical protein
MQFGISRVGVRFACLLVGLLAAPTMVLGVTINYTYLDHVRRAVYQETPTITTLSPDLAEPSAGPIVALDPSDGFIDALTGSLASADWFGTTITTFNWVGTANGVFYVDVYKAIANRDANAAQLLVHYERGPGDPAAADLFWIQTVDTTSRGRNVPANEVIPYVDVYGSSYPAGAKLPFYFRPDETVLDDNPYVGRADIRSSSFTIGANAFDYDIAFWDEPDRSPTNSWRGELFLAFYDATSHFVQVLDGIEWGFVASVPEPPTILLVGVGLLICFAACGIPSAAPVGWRRVDPGRSQA